MIKRNKTEAANLVVALNHLKSAIDVLDLSAAPGDIAAHIDLARHKLEQYMQHGDAINGH